MEMGKQERRGERRYFDGYVADDPAYPVSPSVERVIRSIAAAAAPSSPRTPPPSYLNADLNEQRASENAAAQFVVRL